MYPEQLQNTKFCFKDHMERVLGLGRASFGLKGGLGRGVSMYTLENVVGCIF